MKKVVIVGAGPVGLYLAEKLALNGINVNVIEEHSEIGFPLACTGIISKNIFKFVDLPDDIILNNIYGAEIYSPLGTKLVLKTEEPQAVVINRPRFDQWLAGRAKTAGANIQLDTSFLTYHNGFVKTNHEDIRTDILIGADGPTSRVGKDSGLISKRKFWIGTQILAKLDIDEKMIQIYFSKQFSKNGFAWIVPAGKGFCRIGLGSSTDVASYMQAFIDFLENKYGTKLEPISKQGGLIPLYSRFQKINKDSVYLVGDAAGQVKATTGGGIVMGFSCADQLAEAIITTKKYDLGVARKELRTHLLIRQILNFLPEKKLDRVLIKLLNGKGKEILEKKGDMDFVSDVWKEISKLIFTS